MDGTLKHLGMVATGSVTFTRTDRSNNRVSFSGTIGSEIPSVIYNQGGRYGYKITVRVFVGGVQATDEYGYEYYWVLKEANTQDVQSDSITISGSVKCENQSIEIRYYCWAGGSEGNCVSPNYPTGVTTVFQVASDELPYSPHSNPEIQVDNAGVVWSDRRYDRNVRYRYHTDGHNAYLKLSSGGGWSEVGGSTSWTGWTNRSFNPEACGQPYDAEYRVSGDIKDKDNESFTGHDDGPILYCYGSLKASLGTIPNKMIKGTTYNIQVTSEPDAFVRDNSIISYGVYIRKSTETNYTKYTISPSAGSGRNTHTHSYSFTPDADGTTYDFKAWARHNVTGEEWTSAKKSSTTYVDPVLSDITGSDLFSPQDNISYSWTNNANSLESALQKIDVSGSTKTDVTYSNTSIDLAPSGTYWVQSIFDNSARSVEQLNSILTVTLSNTTSGVSVSKSKAFKVQYKPTKNLSVTSVENQGKTIAIDDDAKTTIQWTYPYNAGAAGIVSGFEVKVYSDSSYNTQVGNTHNIIVNYNDYITGPTYSIELDNELDLQRGVMNYVDITPYYSYPSNNTRAYGPTVQVGQLIKPYKLMTKPVVEYPINDTTWHNKNFRVLFRLPVDNDYSTYTSTIQNAYAYSDMEIKVNNTVYAFSGTYTSNTGNSSIFSSDIDKANTNNHHKYIAINPSLVSGFPDINDGSTYTISVRVQRGNYYFTNQEMQGQDSLGTTVKTWSDWSDTITLNKSSISAQNLASGTEIKVAHFQTVHNWGLRLLACYPINNKDSKDVDQVRGNQIDGSETQTVTGNDEYNAIFRTMQNLMLGVNEYCTYDRAPVKFNSNPSFSALEEIITSAESGTDRYGAEGRNYMNLLTRYMNDYLK